LRVSVSTVGRREGHNFLSVGMTIEKSCGRRAVSIYFMRGSFETGVIYLASAYRKSK